MTFETDMRSDKHRRISGLPPRLALYLSALVFPGAGQFFQRRWLAGSFYTVTFFACVVLLMITIFAPMMWNLRMSIEFAAAGEPVIFHQISFARIFIWLGLGVLVYLAGLLDTFLYYRRQHGCSSNAGPGEGTSEGG